MSTQAKPMQRTKTDIALFNLPCCHFTDTGLELDDDVEFDQWLDIGSILCRASRAVMWWIGDWLAYGEHKYGEKYAQGEAVTGIDAQTLKTYHFVAANVEKLRRRNLSWSHHREVAGLPPAEQNEYLDKAAKEKWRKLELRREIRTARIIQSEQIPKDRPLETDYARAKARWVEIRATIDAWANDFPQWRSNADNFIEDVDYDLAKPLESGTLFIGRLIEMGEWDVVELAKAAKYQVESVEFICRALVAAGTHVFRDQGGKTEDARGATRQLIVPRSIPVGSRYEAAHTSRYE